MTTIPEFKTLICNKDGQVFTVTLNRPEKLNAFNLDMFGEVAQVAEIATNEPDIRLVVFRGTGRAFSSGADLSSLTGNRSQAESNNNKQTEFKPKINEDEDDLIAAGMKHAQGVFDMVEAIPKPTIAAINGHAIGAGLQLSLACDFRIAVRGIKLGLTDVKIGIVPGLGGTTRLPILIGLAKAKELIMTGDLISPEKAFEIGMVNQVVEQESFDRAINELTEKLLTRAPLALEAAKDLLNSGASLDQVAKVQSRLLQTADAVEGMTAFLQKRTPSFSGT